MSRRQEIMTGELVFPKQILEILNTKKEEIIYKFWDNLWHNFLNEKGGVDSILWLERMGRKLFNKLIFHLSKAGWVISDVENNFSTTSLNECKLLKWLTKEELNNVKYHYKFQKYRLKKSVSKFNNLVQINNSFRETGLIRLGFQKAGNNIFRYDTEKLKKYLIPISCNLLKGLGASTKDITYQEIIQELIDWYTVNQEYTMGSCILDSRGRSIFQCSKKIFNPVGSKDARALLIVEPQPLTIKGANAVYAAIAELLDYRGKNQEDKVRYGQEMYIMRTLPDIEKMEENKDYDDLHKLIWLERIYENLDNHEDMGWYTPIELDALASMIQFVGILTNDHAYLDETNLINEHEFKDIWTVDYCSRKHIKRAVTPRLYGSGKEPTQLWVKEKLPYTQEQLNRVMEELRTGLYANADQFKTFIINNVQPQKVMKVNVFNEIFEIECNRFKWELTQIKKYDIYTSPQGIVKTVTREVNLVPDLEQFKRYFVTLLIHCLDSQVANYLCSKLDWVIPNHDAFLIHPNEEGRLRQLYAEKMYDIYKHRKAILREYFKSIGIEKEYPEKNTEEVFYLSGYALK